MNCVSKCHNCASASQTDDRLTENEAEDSIQAGLHAKTPQNNVIVESDGPESDRPETTASMASMMEQSLEGWRLIGQAVQSLFTCSCFAGGQPQNLLSQLGSAGRKQ
ncbi:hypothetical protein ABBQ32_010364 [Trebouxia sp. C0010 RCD-2024]